MTVLTIVLVILLIPFIFAIFTSKHYGIEQEIIINRATQEVFDYLKIIKNTDQYSKWVMTDPTMAKEYKGVDGTVGFIYAWDSKDKKVGKGEQEITTIIEGERIEHELRFIKPFVGKASTYTTVTSLGSQTKVKWGFTGLRNYPMRVMHLVMNLKKILAKDLAVSLKNLKSVLEQG